MPRSIRIECPGAFYHLMARGNRREAIYCDDDDRRYFLKTLGEACAMTGWSVHAWVLMSHHWHLVIDPRHTITVTAIGIRLELCGEPSYVERFNP